MRLLPLFLLDAHVLNDGELCLAEVRVDALVTLGSVLGCSVRMDLRDGGVCLLHFCGAVGTGSDGLLALQSGMICGDPGPIP